MPVNICTIPTVLCCCTQATHTALYNGVLECLRKAAWGYKSISFPAIGTGNLGFQRQDVARIMTDAVAEFAKQMKKLHVYFVVFPKDNKMMEVMYANYILCNSVIEH